MADPLQSWTDGQAETQILEFVRSVTEPGALGAALEVATGSGLGPSRGIAIEGGAG